MGAYPEKALGVLRSVASRMEQWVQEEELGQVALPQIGKTPDGRVSEEVRRQTAEVVTELTCADKQNNKFEKHEIDQLCHQPGIRLIKTTAPLSQQ